MSAQIIQLASKQKPSFFIHGRILASQIASQASRATLAGFISALSDKAFWIICEIVEIEKLYRSKHGKTNIQ